MRTSNNGCCLGLMLPYCDHNAQRPGEDQSLFPLTINGISINSAERQQDPCAGGAWKSGGNAHDQLRREICPGESEKTHTHTHTHKTNSGGKKSESDRGTRPRKEKKKERKMPRTGPLLLGQHPDSLLVRTSAPDGLGTHSGPVQLQLRNNRAWDPRRLGLAGLCVWWPMAGNKKKVKQQFGEKSPWVSKQIC